MKVIFISLVLLATGICTTYGYNILCIFPLPAYSHHQLGKGVVDALLKNGHTVTWVTPYPDMVGKNAPSTLHILDASEVRKFIDGVDMTVGKQGKTGLAFVKELCENVTTTILNIKDIRNAIISQQFDAVVTETFFNDVMAGVAAIQQAPWIVLNPGLLKPNVEDQVDEVRSITTVPIMFNDAGIPMTYIERVRNYLMYVFIAFDQWLERPKQELLYNELFSPLATARNVKLPPFREAHHNVSILLVNSHESVAPTYSLPPNVVNIAGFHIEDKPPALPKDLQELMDNSKQGVIYFSLGSVVRSAALKPHTRKALFAIFAKLPYTVLWKFEEAIEGLPPNIHIRPWFPQQSILAHPNTKFFISHGGQLSILEAVHNGIPLMTIPVFGDQFANAGRATRSGFAVTVNLDENMEVEFEEKLKELVGNYKYTEKAKYISRIFHERPLLPGKLLSHYVELAIISKGADHLRSLSHRYSWVERWVLDFLLAVLTTLLVLLALSALIIRTCYRMIFRRNKKNDSKKKNN